MEKKQKDLHYKKAVLNGARGTLQKALEDALKHLPMPEKRLEMLGPNRDEGRVLLHPRHTHAVLCLTMSAYIKGTLQPIMGIAPKLSDWPIRQVEPPALPGTSETEFLDGYLYLGVWKNHVVFLPTRSCASEQLEDHLNWLLRQNPAWPEGALVSLNDRPPQAYRDKKFQHVRAFKLEAPLESKIVQVGQPNEQETAVSTQSVKCQPGGPTWEGLRSVISQLGGNLPEDLLLDESFDPKDVQVTVQVTCRKRALDRSGPLLDVLANSLRHVTADVVEFTFDDGTKLRGADLKTRTSIRLECSGNMPVPTQVDKAMHDYLQDLIRKQTITADE